MVFFSLSVSGKLSEPMQNILFSCVVFSWVVNFRSDHRFSLGINSKNCTDILFNVYFLYCCCLLSCWMIYLWPDLNLLKAATRCLAEISWHILQNTLYKCLWTAPKHKGSKGCFSFHAIPFCGQTNAVNDQIGERSKYCTMAFQSLITTKVI